MEFPFQSAVMSEIAQIDERRRMVPSDIGKEMLHLVDQVREIAFTGVFVFEGTVDGDHFAQTSGNSEVLITKEFLMLSTQVSEDGCVPGIVRRLLSLGKESGTPFR